LTKKGSTCQVFHQQEMEVRLERRGEQIRTAFVKKFSTNTNFFHFLISFI